MSPFPNINIDKKLSFWKNCTQPTPFENSIKLMLYNTPFTRYNRLTNRLYNQWMFIYTIQPVVNPFDNCVEWTATVHSTGCQTVLYNRFDNRVERTAAVRSTGCQTGLYNRFDKPGCTTSLTTGCIHDTAGCQTSCQTGVTTSWMFVYTIQPVVKPV